MRLGDKRQPYEDPKTDSKSAYSKFKCCAEDELPRVDDAIRVRRAIGIRADWLQPAAFLHVAHVELKCGRDLAGKQLGAISRQKVHIEVGFVVDRVILI